MMGLQQSKSRSRGRPLKMIFGKVLPLDIAILEPANWDDHWAPAWAHSPPPAGRSATSPTVPVLRCRWKTQGPKSTLQSCSTLDLCEPQRMQTYPADPRIRKIARTPWDLVEKANELWLKNSGQHRTFSYGPAILGVEWFFLGMGGCACAKIPCAVSNAGGVSLSLSIAISESLAVEPRAKTQAFGPVPRTHVSVSTSATSSHQPGHGATDFCHTFQLPKGINLPFQWANLPPGSDFPVCAKG